MSPEKLAKLWQQLRADASNTKSPMSRVYRALGHTATGVRASYCPDQDRTELLVEIPETWHQRKEPPQWQGIEIQILALSLGKGLTRQLSLALEDSGSEDVFLYFTSDLISMLENVNDSSVRASIVEECLQKWNRFFMRGGPLGLALKAQMGLFAELLFLENLFDTDMAPLESLLAWKGPERNYHDFDVGGHIIEVKSTSGKEPRKVWINNERQLDDRGTHSLHLMVATLSHTYGGGKTLPTLVQNIEQKLRNFSGAVTVFNQKLLQAGYLRMHAPRYKRSFTLLKTDIYVIKEHTPRIINLQAGLGDIRYTVFLSALENNSVDYKSTLLLLAGGFDGHK